jgi:hypothetical protein
VPTHENRTWLEVTGAGGFVLSDIAQISNNRHDLWCRFDGVEWTE